jgi:excinuclease UvrABC ATPase subunit
MSYVNSLIESTKYFILAPVDKKFENVDDLKREILELGFIRYMVDDKVYSI